MKTKHYNYSNPELEKHISAKDKELKAEAKKLAIHYAKLGLPRSHDTNLAPYIGTVKSGYEALAAYVLQTEQPETLHPEVKMDAEEAELNDKDLENTIRQKEAANRSNDFEGHGYDPGSVGARLRLTLVLTIGLLVGDTVWNTTSFQVTGVSLLFAFFLSFMLSLAIFISSHLFPLLYKQIQRKVMKRIFVASVLGGAIVVFSVLAFFRTQYLTHYGVNIAPWYFMVINLFFFIVSSILSFYLLPDWEDVKEYWHHLKNLKETKKRDKEIAAHNYERRKIREDITAKAKHSMKAAHYVNRLLYTIRHMYYEAIEVFKTTNQIYRTDNATPSCYQEAAPEPNIDHSSIPLITFNPNSK